MKNQDYKIINQKQLAKSPVFEVVRREIQTPMGQIQRDVVLHKPVVAILVVSRTKANTLADTKVLVSHEYRAGINAVDTGIPAGFIEQGEDVINAALRELKEETGIQIDVDFNPCRIEKLFTIASSGGFTNELTHIVVVDTVNDNIIQTNQTHFDTDEYVEHEWLSFQNAIQAIQQGKIQSSSGVAALMSYMSYLLSTTN